MILSHKHKIIFFKPAKTAGTSIEEAIRRLMPLGSSDVYTGLLHSGDRTSQIDHSQNTRTVGGTVQEHTTPAMAKQLFPTEFREYGHFSMVRNPYDLMVSYFWYCYNHPGRTENSRLKDLCAPEPNDSFEKTKLKFRNFLTIPDQYSILYHQRKLEPLLPTSSLSHVNSEMAKVDSIIRFEHMVKDLTLHFGYDGSWEIPRFKTQFRKDKRPYQEYYESSPELIDLVRSSFADIFERFEYKF